MTMSKSGFESAINWFNLQPLIVESYYMWSHCSVILPKGKIYRMHSRLNLLNPSANNRTLEVVLIGPKLKTRL